MTSVAQGKLNELVDVLPGGKVDLLICCASFEERSLSIPKAVGVDRAGAAIIAVNETYMGAVREGLTKLETIFSSKSQRLIVSSTDPIKSADNIAQTIGPCLAGPPVRILLDITTFTRESLLILLAYFRRSLRACDKLYLAYAHAADYSIGDPVESKWLSKGVLDIRSVLAFPGMMVPSKKTHMIILVGFEDDRALEMIRNSEPSFISLGLGDERDEGTTPHQPTNEHRFKKLRSILGHVDEFRFQAYDPMATKTALEAQAALHPECNVLVAPMNTKISTVGAAIFAFENPDVQLCYATTLVYNVANYSSPGKDYYLFEIPRLGTQSMYNTDTEGVLSHDRNCGS